MEKENKKEGEFINASSLINGTKIAYQSKEQNKEFQWQQISDMFNEISKTKQLKYLRLNFPDTDFPESFNHLEESLKDNYENLQTIKLMVRSTGIGVEESEMLSNIISKCQNLSKVYLSLRDNDMGDEGTLKLFEALKSLKKLNRIKLGLTDCFLSEECLTDIKIILNTYKNQLLKFQFHIGGNDFTQQSIIEFVDYIPIASKLIYLNLYFDGLPIYSGTIDAICTTIESMQHLKKFHLSILNSDCQSSDYYKLGTTLYKKEELTKLFLQIRENYHRNVLTDLVLMSFGLINFKTMPMDIDTNFGVFGKQQEKKVMVYLNQIKAHLVQIMAFNSHIASFLPLHSSHVLFDLADY